MTVTAPSTGTSSSEGHERMWQQRALAIAATTAVLAMAWSIVAVGFGEIIDGPSFDDTPPAEIGVGAVIAAAVVSTLAGWALLAVLERWTDRPRRLWTTIAIGFTIISLLGPLSGTGASAVDRFVLVAFHLIAAGIFIPMLRRTVAGPRGSQR